MNIVKNMEVLFAAAAIAAGCATFAMAEVTPKAAPIQVSPAMISTDGQVATVVVSTKRLSAAQKADLDS
jgi:hypothetical protein